MRPVVIKVMLALLNALRLPSKLLLELLASPMGKPACDCMVDGRAAHLAALKLQGRTLLMWAAATGNVEIMNMLIHQVTKIPLLLAVRHHALCAVAFI
jgi:ankyrin repeat protein